MSDRRKAAALIAAGAAAGATLTFLTRRTRARLRKPVTQVLTIAAGRDRVEQFLESREQMNQALGDRDLFGKIDRLELRSAPGGRGTEMYLTMRGIGKYATKDILRRVKSCIEAGEIPTGKRYAA
ncbi:MAG TPA: hypothetical protein VFL13_15865 [Candidatus Baltobacteraceae bacterium]|nr:hypothetical protein [Candidatus Baltobacteraceae bacterium]